MTIKDKVAAVALAEADSRRARDDANASLARLKSELRRGATPVRIVVSGLTLGFASGLATPVGAAAAGGKFVSGPLFSMLLDTVVPGLLAGITSTATGSVEAQDGADGTVDEASDEVPSEPVEEVAPAKPKRKRKPRGPAGGRADA